MACQVCGVVNSVACQVCGVVNSVACQVCGVVNSVACQVCGEVNSVACQVCGVVNSVPIIIVLDHSHYDSVPCVGQKHLTVCLYKKIIITTLIIIISVLDIDMFENLVVHLICSECVPFCLQEPNRQDMYTKATKTVNT